MNDMKMFLEVLVSLYNKVLNIRFYFEYINHFIFTYRKSSPNQHEIY